ncbi:MAG: hypothetical protein AAB930_01090 [Patescibacteria group bacterium]
MPELVGFKSQRHKRMFEQLVEFCGLDGVDYADHDGWEEHTLYKGDKSIILQAISHIEDGTFLLVDYGQSRLANPK